MPADGYQWVGSVPALYAVIDGVRFDGVCSFQSTFELNSIPTAAITLPTGRNMQTGQLAPIHTQLELVRRDSFVQVYLQILPHGHSPGTIVETWPDGPFVIFEGRVAGIGWDRAVKMSQIVVTLTHWLSDLNESSTLSATSQPGNPSSYTFDSSHSSPNGQAGGFSATWLPLKTANINGASVAEDLWKSVLYPILTDVASDDTIDIESLNAGIVHNAAGSDRIKAALLRLSGSSPDYVPLAMNINGDASEVVAGNIAKSINSEINSSWVNTTLWGKLVGDWSPKFGFAICPRVNDCLIIPHAGAFNGQPWQSILKTDYTQSNLVSASSQQIQAVGILGSFVSDTGYSLSENSSPIGLPPLLGIFPQDPAIRDAGILILKGTPDWLSDPVYREQFARAVDGIGQIGQQGFPNDMDPDGQRQPPNPPEQQVRALVSCGIISRWAQHLYISEKLRGCVQELIGRFRVDIAPGSTVKTILPGDRFDETDQLHTTVFATVSRVSHIISAQDKRMATSLLLSHVRNSEENSDPHERYAASRPPLYNHPWRGAKMVDI
jgi:hypothetical protein